MATRAVVPQRQLRIRDEGKPKVVAAEGRTRRILKDIGNLVPDRAVEGKPGPQPTEKNKVTLVMSVTLFCVQGKNKNKRTIRLKSSRKLHLQRVIPQKVNVGVGKGGNVTKAAVTEQPKIVLSSVDERHIINIKDTKSRDKNKRSLSSTLTARSKDEIKVSDYMGAQPDLNAKMRSILIDWLIEVHRKFELMPETLYLAVNIVDRFLSLKTVPRKELQLVGISSMLIACKYEEIWAPEVNDFVSISANTYQREQILVMEKVILGRLEWLLTVPTPYVFLVRYVKASEPSDDEMENMVFFLAELGLMNYPIAISYSPSMIASAAVYAARCTLEKSPIWTATLHHHTGYVEEELKECAELLVNLHRGALDSKLKAVYRKYTSPDRRAVSLLPPAKSLTPDCSPEV
ncbi:G2/mitotic-specific cyclin S13-7 isoform X3 [Benincasa hispida]|uniref:G2/mitotic-specific cyclin S13-7 isoform X3 n=1 Tax=Benincasa hispida TaxID=102211 RepID=UPI0019022A98|nr:G2/mitotic-specific cyclin S13-7 isoform X3 [Benincasa hispida]